VAYRYVAAKLGADQERVHSLLTGLGAFLNDELVINDSRPGLDSATL